MVNKPLVSIVIPTHNRSGMLQRAVNSLLNQSYPNIEIVISNDGSTDNTKKMLSEKFGSLKNIVIVNSDTPMGPQVARNKGIEKATGEFVTFLDDDDEFHSKRVEKMINAWDDKWAYIATGVKVILKYSRVLESIPPKVISLSSMLHQMSAGNSVLTKKERLVALGGFDENLSSSQDYDMWIRLNAKYGDAFAVKEPLFIVHEEHESPRITVSQKKVKGHFRFYKKHKHLMDVEQRKSKLFELYKYKNKKISLFKAMCLGKNKKKLAVLKFYLKVKFPNQIEFLKLVVGKVKTKIKK